MSFLNQAESITRRLGLLVYGLTMAAAVAAADIWREAPEYLSLFAPALHREAYVADVSSLDLDTVLARLADDPTLARTPGAWVARSQAAVDAFGQSGAYDRWKLSRLYGSRQPRVARGARMNNGRVAESWTLISPYPDPSLKELRPGTLLLVVRLP